LVLSADAAAPKLVSAADVKARRAGRRRIGVSTEVAGGKYAQDISAVLREPANNESVASSFLVRNVAGLAAPDLHLLLTYPVHPRRVSEAAVGTGTKTVTAAFQQ
jgi:hypothetical protein